MAGLRLTPAFADSVEVTWSSWGNTGEVANLKKFTEDYNASQSDIAVKYLPSPNDGYDAKLLTQLTGGTAPDLFYAADGQVSTIVKNTAAYDLTELLSSEKSQSKPEQFAGDLWGPAKTADGKYYGVPVDCNPLVLWYNKKILQDAGISEMPADTYEAGNWNWDTFQSILDAVTAKGKRGVVLADWWAPRYSWVTVNGEVATMGQNVVPGDRIEIDQKAQERQDQQVTILLNKPMGYVSGQAEDGHEPAVVLITNENRWNEDRSKTRFNFSQLKGLAPCGRLDIDSVGLLVLTQDGRVARQLIGEDSTVDKEYLVRVSLGEVATNVQAVFPPAQLARLRHGLALDGQPLKPAQVDWQNPEQLRFVLREGKKRQIRRMCEQVGLHVTGLKRIRIGRVQLGQLPVGQWRYLGPDETF